MSNYPRLKKWLLRTGIALGCIVLLILAAAGVHYLVAQQKLESVYAHMREDSIPLTWEEYYQLFPNFEDHLAAQPHFFDALDHLAALVGQAEEETGGRQGLYPPKFGIIQTPGMIDTFDNVMRIVAPGLEDVRSAVAAEPFWFIPQPEGGLDAQHTERALKLRNAVLLFAMTASLYAQRDEPQKAIQPVVDSIRAAGVFHRGSFVIDETFRVLCEGTALRSLEYVLANTNPSQEHLRELQTLLSRHTDMQTGIMGECVFIKQGYATVERSKLSPIELGMWLDVDYVYPWHTILMYLPYLPGWMQMEEAYTIEIVHSGIMNWNLPYQDFIRKNKTKLNAVPWLYASRFWDFISMLKRRELEATGRWTCGRIAIAIELYSQKHGKLPAMLTDLVPEYLDTIPAEPFYGKPFIYKTNGNAGMLSFSVPGSKRDPKFKVFANREHIKLKAQEKPKKRSRLCD